MKALIKNVKFLTCEEREGKNGKYYLYTFMQGGKIYPAIYSKEYFKMEEGKTYNVNIDIGSFNGRFTLTLSGLE